MRCCCDRCCITLLYSMLCLFIVNWNDGCWWIWQLCYRLELHYRIIENNVWVEWRAVYALDWELFWCSNNHQNNPSGSINSPAHQGAFTNTYELLNPRALKISMLYKKIASFSVWERYFVWISKVPFEISHKISNPFIERCAFYSHVKI